MKRMITFITVLSLSILASQENSAPKLLSTYCITDFRKVLLKGKPPSQLQIKQVITQDSNEPVFEKLKVALQVRWMIPSLNMAELDASLIPTKSEIEKAFPHLKTNSSNLSKSFIYNGFAKIVLEEKVSEYAKSLARELANESSTSKKLDYLKELISELNLHGPSWYHQTRVDKIIDLIAGFDNEALTGKLQNRKESEKLAEEKKEETYDDASPSILFTPYHEFSTVFSIQELGLQPNSLVSDIGAGTGRLGVFLGATHPEWRYLGYEIVPLRVQEGQKVFKQLGLHNHKLIQADLSSPDFKLHPADVYYAFNPVTGETFDKVLEDLRQAGVQSGKNFKLILFGPAPFAKAEAQPWLRKLHGFNIPEDSEFALYEFIPEKASHTVILDSWKNIQAKKKNSATINREPAEKFLDASDRSRLEALAFPQFEIPAPIASNSMPNHLVAWSKVSPIRMMRFGESTLMNTHQSASLETWVEPIGGSPKDKANALLHLLELARKNNKTIRVEYLSKEVSELVRDSTPFKIKIEQDPDGSDYIYFLDLLADLKATKKLRDRAGQARRFDEAYPNVKAEEIADNESEMDHARHFLKDWRESREKMLENETDTLKKQILQEAVFEGMRAEVLINNKGEKLVHFILKDGEKTVGLSVAEIVPMNILGKRENVLVLYIQKTNPEYKNAVVKLNQALMNYVKEAKDKFGNVRFVNLTHVNMMDDGGIESLRRMKKDYSPIEGAGVVYKLTAEPK